MNRSSSGFFLLFCVLFSCVPLSGLEAQRRPVVKTVDVKGLRLFSPEELLGTFSTRLGLPYQPDVLNADLDRLKTMYADSGYLFFRVDSLAVHTSADSADLLIAVSEGKRSLIDSIRLRGNRAIPDSVLMGNLGIARGTTFLRSRVEQGVHLILAEYEKNGFALATVTVDDVTMVESPEDYRVGFTYWITEGDRVKVQNLRFEGNTTTRSSVLIREARLRGDEYFSDELARKVKMRLERMQLFTSVSEPELMIDQARQGGMLVRVKEGNSNRFDGIIGYVPSPRPGLGGYVTGLVDVQFRNLFGTARKLAARWFREDQTTQEIALQYDEPWIASYPVNGRIGFDQRFQDSTYVRSRFDLGLDFSLTEQLFLGVVVSRTDVIPSESYGRLIVAKSQNTSVGLTLSYDTRNDPATPVSGVYYHTGYDIGKKESDGPGSFSSTSNSLRKIAMDLDYYIEPFGGQVVAEELHMLDFRSGRIELGDLFRLGGAKSLRGYREGQFLGSTLVWSNLEYRFMVEKRSYFYGFVDAGYIVTPEEPLTGLKASEETKVGYGLGIRMDTSLGLVGVSIGFGEGDTFSTAKLHLRLINAF